MRIRLASLLLLSSLCLSCSNNTRIAGLTMINGEADFDSTDKLSFEIGQTAFPMTFAPDRGATAVSFTITIAHGATAALTGNPLAPNPTAGSPFRLAPA